MGTFSECQFTRGSVSPHSRSKLGKLLSNYRQTASRLPADIQQTAGKLSTDYRQSSDLLLQVTVRHLNRESAVKLMRIQLDRLNSRRCFPAGNKLHVFSDDSDVVGHSPLVLSTVRSKMAFEHQRTAFAAIGTHDLGIFPPNGDLVPLCFGAFFAGLFDGSFLGSEADTDVGFSAS